MNEQYIECEVYKGADGFYYFNLTHEQIKILGVYKRPVDLGVEPSYRFSRLSEAVNIPGFCGVEYYFGNIKCGNGLEHFGEPKIVRFRVPVDKKLEEKSKQVREWCESQVCVAEPPKCEDCANKEGKYCDSTAKRCGKLGMEWWEVNDCEFERTLAGKCGPDGKCFVPKEKSDAS